jgi:hypothetical protein
MNPLNLVKGSIIVCTQKDDNGKPIIGKVTKIGPWSKNPKITVLNWISVNGDFKGRCDAAKVTLSDYKPPVIVEATVDSCMAAWSLGKEKKGPMMMEGHYFESALYFNGKKVGIVCDRGDGGPMDVTCKDFAVARQFEADCKVWGEKNGHNDADFETFYSWWHDGRPEGKDAKTYLGEREAEMKEWLASVKPIHVNAPWSKEVPVEQFVKENMPQVTA